MKESFREPTIRNATRKALAEAVLAVIQRHVEGGIARVTSRQLYYRLVAANLVPNTERSYKMVTALLADMRYWGWIDWEFIVDLGREPIIPQQFRDVNHLAAAAVNALRYDRWVGQEHYVEVWVEKQALQSVLEPIGDEMHVAIVVNKGYTSASAMYRAAQRLNGTDRSPVVIYFGDLDPSGEDMLRDIRERLAEFGATPELTKVALTLEQVREHSCPPNPAKQTDSRFAGFAADMDSSDDYAAVCEAQGLDPGETFSWELDSLPVAVLSSLVRSAVAGHITDEAAIDDVIEREDHDRRALKKAAEAIAAGDFR